MFAEDFSPVVQWIECQIPVLMMGVRIPSGEQRKAFRKRGFFCIRRDENSRAGGVRTLSWWSGVRATRGANNPFG